ncbi:RNA-binding cell elongation regulator Jag/EloR [Acidaminococcus timonensis]|uniref:RNA-binding cell elongation regulator Jag/EloR n=1 Tax=Acidaminococcus timonensis TaxID=1871002 RepID=UPI0025E81DC8|nr:RNA-binding cell elongation regulator Jag/EloR [Acidaminococcus timonensis]
MNVVEKTGKTVEDAVKAALAELGVSRDEVEVEVLESSKSSILGLFGGRDAKVRVTVKEAPAPEPEVEPVAEAAPEKEEAPEEPAAPEKKEATDTREADLVATGAAAKEFLEKIFAAMGMDLIIEKFINHKEDEVVLKIHGEGIGVLIGKHGQTLDALQYLTNLAGNKGRKTWNRVILDAENYRERRRQTLERLAKNLADRVKRTHKKAMLEPMNPYERKIVHMSLQNDPAITTYSEGEEPYRKVVIDLK